MILYLILLSCNILRVVKECDEECRKNKGLAVIWPNVQPKIATEVQVKPKLETTVQPKKIVKRSKAGNIQVLVPKNKGRRNLKLKRNNNRVKNYTPQLTVQATTIPETVNVPAKTVKIQTAIAPVTITKIEKVPVTVTATVNQPVSVTVSKIVPVTKTVEKKEIKTAVATKSISVKKPMQELVEPAKSPPLIQPSFAVQQANPTLPVSSIPPPITVQATPVQTNTIQPQLGKPANQTSYSQYYYENPPINYAMPGYTYSYYPVINQTPISYVEPKKTECKTKLNNINENNITQKTAPPKPICTPKSKNTAKATKKHKKLHKKKINKSTGHRIFNSIYENPNSPEPSISLEPALNTSIDPTSTSKADEVSSDSSNSSSENEKERDKKDKKDDKKDKKDDKKDKKEDKDIKDDKKEKDEKDKNEDKDIKDDKKEKDIKEKDKEDKDIKEQDMKDEGKAKNQPNLSNEELKKTSKEPELIEQLETISKQLSKLQKNKLTPKPPLHKKIKEKLGSSFSVERKKSKERERLKSSSIYNLYPTPTATFYDRLMTDIKKAILLDPINSSLIGNPPYKPPESGFNLKPETYNYKDKTKDKEENINDKSKEKDNNPKETPENDNKSDIKPDTTKKKEPTENPNNNISSDESQTKKEPKLFDKILLIKEEPKKEKVKEETEEERRYKHSNLIYEIKDTIQTELAKFNPKTNSNDLPKTEIGDALIKTPKESFEFEPKLEPPRTQNISQENSINPSYFDIRKPNFLAEDLEVFTNNSPPPKEPDMCHINTFDCYIYHPPAIHVDIPRNDNARINFNTSANNSSQGNLSILKKYGYKEPEDILGDLKYNNSSTRFTSGISNNNEFTTIPLFNKRNENIFGRQVQLRNHIPFYKAKKVKKSEPDLNKLYNNATYVLKDGNNSSNRIIKLNKKQMDTINKKMSNNTMGVIGNEGTRNIVFLSDLFDLGNNH